MKQLGKIWIFFDGKSNSQSKPLNITQAQALILNLLKQNNSQVYLWTPGWKEWCELHVFLESEQEYFMAPPSLESKIDDKTQLITPTKEEKTVISKTQVSIEETPKSFEMTKNNFNPEITNTSSKKVDYGYFYPDFRAEQIDLNINKIPKKFSSKNDSPTALSASSSISSVESDRRDRVRFNLRLEILLISKNGKTFRSETDNISMGGIKLLDRIPKDFLYLDFSVTIINSLEKDPKKSRIHFGTKCVGDISDPCRLIFINPDKKNRELLEKLINQHIKKSKSA